MSVKRRLAMYSGMRVDVPHIRAIESAVSNDFDSMLRGFVTGLNKPYLLRGFKINIPNAAINAAALTVQVADSAVLHSSATESGTILSVAPDVADQVLDSSNARVIGAFQSGTVNYISLDYRRIIDTTTIDQTAGWSASQKIEFQRTTPIGRVLDFKFIISTNGFSTNLPLYIVKVNSAGSVEWITKATTNLFRLGEGGDNPNPHANYTYGNLLNSQTNNRREWVNTDLTLSSNPITVGPGDDANAFDFGDFAIGSLKEWMDAVMTRIKEMTGSQYWYIDSGLPDSPLKLADVWWDSIGSVMTGVGSLSYNLVLESTAPSVGRFQDFMHDPTILPGDVYVQGFDSGTKATLTSYNNNQLIINSMTNAAYLYNELIRTRRIFRPSQDKFSTTAFAAGSDRFAHLKRIAFANAALTNNIASWAYENLPGSELFYTKVTITCTAPHAYKVGDMIKVAGLAAGASVAPNGTYQVKAVPNSSDIVYYTPVPQSGSATVLGGNYISPESAEQVPYMPKFSISAWSYVGAAIKLVAPEHSFIAPASVAADTTNLSYNLTNVSSTANLKVGMQASGTGISADTVITKILSASSVELSRQATATAAAVSITFKDRINVAGLNATTNIPAGVYAVDSLGPGQDEVNFTASATPSGPATVLTNNFISPDFYSFNLSLAKAIPAEYNVTDVLAFALSHAAVYFKVGPDTLPNLGLATGGLEYDGVVAYSTVRDPVRVTTITNDGAGNLTVTTTVPHGIVTTGGPIAFTLFGDAADSQYIRSYSGVSLTYMTPTVFKINGTGIISVASYTNPGNSQNTFVKFSNNPYEGPIQWDSDIVIKGIIGDKSFVIPKTAIAKTTSEDGDVSPLANLYNVNGQTGTLYLRDGEVAYALLERDRMVSNGAAWSTAGGGALVVGTTAPTDDIGGNLVSGDWVKFEDESEGKWLKIAGTPGTPIVTNSFSLVNDAGQSPNIVHRPAKSGKLLYAKGSYPKIYVKQHYLMDENENAYWIAVRRDNSGVAKIYFRGLEIEAGEVRQVNDNQTSNLLTYTGAFTEGAVNPNYSVADKLGEYIYLKDMTVEAVDNQTRMITLTEAPERGLQKGDRLSKRVGNIDYFYTVKTPVSTRTVIVIEDTSTLLAADDVTYYRANVNILDPDNLTLAIRKEDREIGSIQTDLSRPIYDESLYIRKMTLTGVGTVRSGSYVYTGTLTNPTALAWVVHGNASVSETIESAPIAMPGGHSSVGSSAILVHVYYGTFSNGDGLFQNGVATGRIVNNLGLSETVEGGAPGNGVELVLPPNRRTQVLGTEYVVFGTHSHYRASQDPILTGEDLLVIVNDGIRQAGIDYEETFGGPKAKIRLLRDIPPNTRLRVRTISSFGSALAAKSTDISLQDAYNGGATIDTVPNRPVEITSDNVNLGNAAQVVRGSLLLNGGNVAAGGIFNETLDKSFVIGKEDDKPKESWTALEAVKSHDSHPDSAVKRKTAAQTVTSNIGTVIADSAVALTDGNAYRIKVSAVARRSDGPLGVASFNLEGTFYRTGGTVYAAGSPVSIINGTDGDGIDYAMAFGISGNDIVAVVYGTVGATLQWALTIEVQGVGLAS